MVIQGFGSSVGLLRFGSLPVPEPTSPDDPTRTPQKQG